MLGDAAADLAQARRLAPEDARVLLATADLAVRRGRPGEARASLGQLRNQHPEYVAAHLALARLVVQQGRREAAVPVLQKALQIIPDQSDLLVALVELHLDGEEFAAAGKLLERLRQPGQADILEGEMRLRRRDYVGARRLLQEVIGKGKASPSWTTRALLDLARCHEQLGDPNSQLAALRRAVALDGSSAQARLALAAALEAAGLLDDSLEQYRQTFDRGVRQPVVAQRLTWLLAERGQHAEADEVLRRQDQAQPLTGSLARLAADVALRLHNPERAAEMARHAVPADSRDYRDQVWLGQVLALAGRCEQAELALRRAIELRADQPETWLALVAQLAHCGRDADAEAALEEARRKLPPSVVPLTVAVAQEALGHLTQAEADYREVLHRQPHDGLALQRAASFLLRLDRPAEAVPLLRQLLDPAVSVPAANRVWARRQLALALVDGNEGATTEALALLAAEAATDPAAQRVRDFIAATGPDQRTAALARLETSLVRLPPTAGDWFRLARLYETAGQPDKARQASLEALILDIHNPEYLARHIDRLLQTGHPDEARPWLTRLEKQEPDSQRVRAFRKVLHAAS
jgi:tetratricopeptide (TPR) repeat protein